MASSSSISNPRQFCDDINNEEIKLFPNSRDKDALFGAINQLAESRGEIADYSRENPGFKEKLENVIYNSYRVFLWAEAMKCMKATTRGGREKAVFLRLQKRAVPEQAQEDAKRDANFLADDSPDGELKALESQKAAQPTNREISKLMYQLYGSKETRRQSLPAVALGRSIAKHVKEKLTADIHFFKGFLQAIGLHLAQNKLAEDAAAELLASEPTKLQRKRGQKQEDLQQPVVAEAEAATVQEQHEEPVSAECSNAEQINNPLERLRERKTRFKFAPRVRRWEETTDIDSIRRKFTEKGDYYADLTDDEIRSQRAYHLCVGVDVIFSNSRDREIYTFSTPTGLGMMVRFTQNEEHIFGTLYFGIDHNLIYHRHFVPLKNQDTAAEIINQRHPKLPSDRVVDDGWYTKTRFIFHKEEGECIRVEYPFEDFEIMVFPVLQ